MQYFVGTYRDGKIVLDQPVDWAEGERVIVTLASEHVGLVEGVWPDDGSPEGEAEILRRMREFEALEDDPEAAADFEAALKEVRRFSREATPDKSEL